VRELQKTRGGRAAVGLVGEVAEHEPRFDDPVVLLQRAGQRQLAGGGV